MTTSQSQSSFRPSRPAGQLGGKNLPRRIVPFVLLATVLGVYLGYRHYLSARPFEWAGTVESREVTVGSRTGGRVKQVLAHEGDRIEAGKPLVILEAGDLTAARAAAQAQLAQAKANLDKLQKGPRPEEIAQARARAAQANAAYAETRHGGRSEEIAQAQARFAQAQALAAKAQLDADRARKLLTAEAITQAEADNAETQLQTALAQRDAQKEVLGETRAGVRSEVKAQAGARAAEAEAAAQLVIAGARVEDVQVAEAQVVGAKARVDQLDAQLAELVILAPVTARIESLDLRPGDLLAPNAPAATLLEDNQLYVRIYVPETQIGHVQVGDKVGVRVDSFADKTFAAKVESIASRGEYSPRNLQTADERADQVFAVRIGLIEGQDRLRAGMAASIAVAR